MTPFSFAYHHATPHGVISAVVLPDAPDPVPPAVLARLHPEEAAYASTLRMYRQVQYVGGRLALRAACEQLGVRPAALLPDERGAPRAPAGVTASVSHKSMIAVGMAARDDRGRIGVDIEDYGPPRLGIAPRVLTEAELREIADQPDSRRWISILLRFSVKESVYKALDPFVHRYVGFHEAEVWPDLHGAAEVRLTLANGEGPFEVDARYEWLHGRILTSVCIRPA